MTRVNGELAPSTQAQVSGTYTGTASPFEPGSAAVSYTVTNTGNTRLAVKPSITLTGPFGWFPQRVELDPIAELAPGESRTRDTQVPGIWPLFMTFLDD